MTKIKSSTRKEYIARINRVVDYLHDHLDKKVSLEELAKVAAFSPFHFHRIFKGMVGESINEYVARLRLQWAATMLLYNPHCSITEIAFTCGFSSSANFARAFKQHYGCSATKFRKMKGSACQKAGKDVQMSTLGKTIRKQGKTNGKLGKDIPPPILYSEAEDSVNHMERRRKTMKVEVKNLPGYRVAYIRVMDGYDSKKIGPAFQRVIKWAQARDLMGPDTLILGVGLDNPEVTPKEKCRYDACVTVPSNTQGEGEVGVYDIPPGKYAIYRVEGEYAKINEQIGKFWDQLMGQWFPDSGYQPDDRPCFEIYRETEEEYKAGKFVADLCEPVKPL